MDVRIVLDDGGDLAAWVQAWGSIAAILASSALALWVPLHLRRLDAKSAVMRDRATLLAVSRTLFSMTGSLADRVQTGEPITEAMVRMIAAEVDLAKGQLAQVSHGRLGPTANAACIGARLGAAAILEAAQAIHESGPPPYTGGALDLLIGTNDELVRIESGFAGVTARRIRGQWWLAARDETF